MKQVRPKRAASRKSVQHIHVTELTSLTNYTIIAHECSIVDASNTGFCLIIDRHSLVPKELKSSLSLDGIVGQQVVMFLPEMNLDLDGKVKRTQHRGKGQFEVGVEFSPEVPEYWRECLVDLLPAPGEFDE